MTDSQIKTLQQIIADDLERAREAQAGWAEYLHETRGCAGDASCRGCAADLEEWSLDIAERERRDFEEFGAEGLAPERGGPV